MKKVLAGAALLKLLREDILKYALKKVGSADPLTEDQQKFEQMEIYYP